jgi:endonuclease-3
METAATLKGVLDQLRQDYPEAGTRLHYNSLFELLVAVVLSAQTTDERVNLVTERLFAQADTPEKLARLPLSELEELVKPVGLHRSKAKNLQGLALKLLQSYDGKVPEDFDALLSLPGVGRKTANVVTAVGLDRPGLGVDTHVARMARRLGYTTEENPARIEARLKALIPPERWGEAHHLLIAHGRAVCKSRSPRCAVCSVAEFCPSAFKS